VWPLGIAVVAAGAMSAGACTLLARRDLGAGLLQQHAGPAEASRSLTRPSGFAVNLQRGSLLAWTSGLLVIGLAYGSLGDSVGDILKTSPKMVDFFTRGDTASLVDSFFATSCLMVALMGTGFTIQSVLRLRVEEVSGRAEPVLATALSRWRWAGSHAVVAVVGTAVMLAVSGAGIGLAFALRGGGLDEVPRLAGAALVQAPAAWFLGGIGLALFGWAPRASAVAWAPLVFCVVAGLIGPLLGLPDWVADLSPYNYLPQLPAEHFTAVPVVAVTATALAFFAIGLAGFRRRDLG
jgi:ABC-2 type transport system permease protein